ncbi:uncharacterized protein LOC126058367 isoform X2 [Elephas maximus indicus]|uniref:uncharacterized protein LOC126058367 isoform X2 n=1 Tax=Elephas maximus indicus TaxID=99487 RepID=UPI002116D508|nr:uncharacterized protein LOC126058367 isoform X2 [Elephas maximus indicus]
MEIGALNIKGKVRKRTEGQGEEETVQKQRGVTRPGSPGALRRHSGERLWQTGTSVQLQFPQGKAASHTAYPHLGNRKRTALSAKGNLFSVLKTFNWMRHAHIMEGNRLYLRKRAVEGHPVASLPSTCRRNQSHLVLQSLWYFTVVLHGIFRG